MKGMVISSFAPIFMTVVIIVILILIAIRILSGG
jgi:hypothetical protein